LLPEKTIGAEYKGKKAGTIGRFGCFSFFPTKNLGCFGDGGLVSCKEKDYEYIMKLRVHGSSVKYIHEFLGINSRLDAIQAAVLQVKLAYIDDWNARRRKIAQIYNKGLKTVQTPHVFSGNKHVYHQYTILCEKRDELKAHLDSKGVTTGVYYPLPLHLQDSFEFLGYSKGDMPVSEMLSEKILSLPIFPEMTDDQVTYVIECVNEFYR